MPHATALLAGSSTVSRRPRTARGAGRAALGGALLTASALLASPIATAAPKAEAGLACAARDAEIEALKARVLELEEALGRSRGGGAKPVASSAGGASPSGAPSPVSATGAAGAAPAVTPTAPPPAGSAGASESPARAQTAATPAPPAAAGPAALPAGKGNGITVVTAEGNQRTRKVVVVDEEAYTRTGCSLGMFKGPPPGQWNNERAWQDLEQGMSSAQVERLLGDEHYNVGSGARVIWQYGKCGDSARGQVLLVNGKVEDWRAPKF